jgi:UDP-N-acetylglucosamine transferase subunit ALG13
MIFVTVGAQMAFDRLVRAVDEWAAQSECEVFAQIGPSDYMPANIGWTRFLEPAQFGEKVAAADAIVAHAGMGSILTALELGKPILVMPRRGNLRETRNDHQVATARRLVAQRRVTVAWDEQELAEKLDQIGSLEASDRISSHADARLLGTLRAFLKGFPVVPAGIEETPIDRALPVRV